MNSPASAHCAPARATTRDRRLATLLVAAVAFFGIAGCGGGDVAGVGTGGTGSFAVGSISGFGSVIVNGVRFDDSSATVVDDDGAVSDRSALKLGMVVEINGSLDATRLNGAANRIVYVAEMTGPVTAVDATAGTITVFGQSVRVTARTVFDAVAGVAGLGAGNVVEVHALRDPAGLLVATRIERKASSPAAYRGDFRVRGPVGDLTGSGATRRFTVSTAPISTNASTRFDGTLQDGAFVSVRMSSTAGTDGSYLAARVQVKNRGFDDSIGEAEIEGFVSAFTSATERFEVAGFPVRLAAGATFEDGVAADLGNGARVEVEGAVVGGVLFARKVDFEREDDDDGQFEFKGIAACVSCGPSGGTFTVQGVTLEYDSNTLFDDGITFANLHSRNVEVKAIASNTAGGQVLIATQIEDND